MRFGSVAERRWWLAVAATLGVLTLAAWFLPPLIRRLRRTARG